MILDVQNIAKSFGEDKLFEGVSFHVEDHEKTALVGINGAGKSTLLKIILSKMECDKGQVVLAKDSVIGYLSQHPDIKSELSIMDELMEVKKDILRLEVEMRTSELNMKKMEGEALENEMARYARLTEAFEKGGGYALKSECVGILKGLGFQKMNFPRKLISSPAASAPDLPWASFF